MFQLFNYGLSIGILIISILESIAALRIEDFVSSAEKTTSRLLEFLRFPANPLIDTFLEEHSTKRNQDRNLEGRNYKSSSISLDYIQKIQTGCKNIFQSLGYSFIDGSDKYFSTDKLSVLSKSQNESWTL